MKDRVRRGSILMESLMAITLLAAALTGVSQLLVFAGRQQRIVESRRLAQREAGNVMERIMARPDSQLAAEELAAIAISPETRARLPSATVKVLLDARDVGGANQVRVEVAWSDFGGQTEQIELTAWKSARSNP